MSKRNYYQKPSRTKKEFCYCSGKSKICYPTREAALAERNKLYKRSLVLRAYRCPRTMYRNATIIRWHLTSQVTRTKALKIKVV